MFTAPAKGRWRCRVKAMAGRRDDQHSRANMLVNSLIHGGMVTRPDTAVAIAEAILKGHYGDEGLVEQRPVRPP